MCGCERHWNCRAACECDCQHRDTDCSQRKEHPHQRHVYEDGLKPERKKPPVHDSSRHGMVFLPDGVLS